MGIQINGNTNNINAGIGSLSIEDIHELDLTGIATASNFKTGSSNLHSTGLTVGNALVHSTGINVGTGATVHCPATNVLTFGTNSNERLRIASNGKITHTNFDGVGFTMSGTGDPTFQISDADGTNQYVQLAHNGGDSYIVTRNNTSHGEFLVYSQNGSDTLPRIKIGSDGTWSKYLNSSSTVQAAFGGTGQINGITGLPSMAGSPLVVGRDTGSLRSAFFGGHLNFTSGYGIQGNEFSVYGNTSGLYLKTNVSGDAIIFQTHNGSSVGERVRIDSSGRVLIGTTDPGGGNADDLTVATSGNTGITIRSGTSNTGNVFFSDATSGAAQYAGAIEFHHSDNSLRLNVGNTNYFRIASNGQITTRGAQGTSFNNAGTGDFGSFLTVNGGHTANQWGILSLEGNSSASGYSVGQIQFINQNNANSSTGSSAQSRMLARIEAYTETSDSNAGDDSGGTLRIFTKPEAANPTERLTIRGSGNIGINQSSPSTNLEVCPTDGVADTATIFINAKTHDTNAQSEAILKFGYGHSGSPDGVGHIKMVEDANNSFDADFIFGLPINNNSGGSVTNERVRITSEGQIRVQGTSNTSTSTSNVYPVLNINNLKGSYTAGNIIGGVTFGKSPGHTGGIRAGMLALYSNTGSDSSNVGTDLVFRTANESAGDSNEKLRITSGGAVVANNFGIGVDNRWKIRPNSSYNNLALEYSTGTSLADTNIKAEFYNTGNVRFSTNTGAANGLKIYQNSIESQIYTAHFPELLTTGNPNPTGDAAGRMPYSTISGNNVTIAANTYYVAMAGRKFYLPALSSTTINNNCSLYFDLNTMSYVNNASGIIESTVERIVLYYNAQSGTGALGRIVPLCNKMNLMAVKKMYISCVTATTDQYEYNNGSVDSWRGDLWQTTGAANANNGSDYVRYLYQNNGYSLVEGRYYLFWGRSPRAFNQYVNEGYMETGSRDSYNFGTGASQFWMQGASYWASGAVGSCLDLGVQTIVHA